MVDAERSVPFNANLSAEWVPPGAKYDVAGPRLAVAIPHLDVVGVFVFSAKPGARAFMEPGTSPLHELVPLPLTPTRHLPAGPDLPRPHQEDDGKDRHTGNEERVRRAQGHSWLGY